MADFLNLKTTYVEQQDPSKAEMIYRKEIDTLFIRLDIFGGLHIACYLNDGVYALFDPETREVVGFQVEAWEKNFLNIHPDLQKLWSSPEVYETKGYTVEFGKSKEEIMGSVSQYTPDECYA
jgi:hypothetical protein